MTVLVCDISALQFWRVAGSRFLQSAHERRQATNRARTVLARLEKPSLQGGNRRPGGVTLPVRALISADSQRVATNSIATRRWMGPLPEASFVDVGREFLVSSPEFCFAQMAGSLSLTNLIQLGFELCGTYAMSEGAAPAKRVDAPLTTVAKLRDFISSAPRFHGRKKSLRALSHVVEQSASPMESVLAMMLCLPNKLGGYGLGHPLMNHRVDIRMHQQKHAFRSYCLCDLYWPSVGIDIEYDSDLHHTGAAKIAEDARRRTALMAEGVDVVVLTSQNLTGGEGLNEAARFLAKRLGKRLHYKDPQFTHAHRALYAECLSWLNNQ